MQKPRSERLKEAVTKMEEIVALLREEDTPEPRKWKAGDRVVMVGTVAMSETETLWPVIKCDDGGRKDVVHCSALRPEGDLVSLAKVREIVETEKGKATNDLSWDRGFRCACDSLLDALTRAFPEAKP